MTEKTEGLSRAHTHTHLDTWHSRRLQPRAPTVGAESAFCPSPATAHIIQSIRLRALQLSGPHTNSTALLLLHRGRGENPAELRNNPRTAALPKLPEFCLETAPGDDGASVEQTRCSPGEANPRTAERAGWGEVRGCWGSEGPSPTSAAKAVEGGGREPAGFRGRRSRAEDAPAARESRERSPKKRSPAGGRGRPGDGRSRVRGRAAPRRSGGGAMGVGDPARSRIFQRGGSGEVGRAREGSEGGSSPWRWVGVRRLSRR